MSSVSSLSSLMRRSSTGSQLLDQVSRRGVKIKVVDSIKSNDPNSVTNGFYDPNSNTITVRKDSQENMLKVLAHESVHAVTREDGNSKTEEMTAFKMGEKVATEAGLNSNPKSDSQIASNVNSCYQGLQANNGIQNDLSKLGLNAGGASAIQKCSESSGSSGTGSSTASSSNPFAADSSSTGAAANTSNIFAMIMQLLQQILALLQGQTAGTATTATNTSASA